MFRLESAKGISLCLPKLITGAKVCIRCLRPMFIPYGFFSLRADPALVPTRPEGQGPTCAFAVCEKR